jgi:phosphatidate phosphatase LPIN
MVGQDWNHKGVASLFSNIEKNGYYILYLTARAIGQVKKRKNFI